MHFNMQIHLVTLMRVNTLTCYKMNPVCKMLLSIVCRYKCAFATSELLALKVIMEIMDCTYSFFVQNLTVDTVNVINISEISFEKY